MASYYRDLIKILRSNGIDRIPGGKGSHEKWRNNRLRKTVVVPRNCNRRHTANEVLKQAGLPKAF